MASEDFLDETSCFDSSDTELADTANTYTLREDEHSHILEQLKHEILVLQEWKSSVGLIAVDRVDSLHSELLTFQSTNSSLHYNLEALAQEKHALSLEIAQYRDEIQSLSAKLQSQTLTEHRSLTAQLQTQSDSHRNALRHRSQQIQSKDAQIENLRAELSAAAQSLETLRKDNASLIGEHEKYQILLENQSEENSKLENALSVTQNEFSGLKMENEAMGAQLRRESADQRQQLMAAETIANGLSDQLREIENYQNSPHLSSTKGSMDISCLIGMDADEMPFGRPLMEKRRTLRIVGTQATRDSDQSLGAMNSRPQSAASSGGFGFSDDDFGDQFLQPRASLIGTSNSNSINSRRSSRAMSTHKQLQPVNEALGMGTLSMAQSLQDSDGDEAPLFFESRGSRSRSSCSGGSRSGSDDSLCLPEVGDLGDTQCGTSMGECESEWAKERRALMAVSTEWEGKYRALRREVKKAKVKKQSARQRMGDVANAGPKCTSFWSWGSGWASKGCASDCVGMSKVKKVKKEGKKKGRKKVQSVPDHSDDDEEEEERFV